MRAVWKYPLRYEARQTVMMPAGSKPFLVHEQHGAVCVWAEVDPALPADTPYTFQIVGTGHAELGEENRRRYLGTAFVGPFVWHVHQLMEGDAL